MTICCNIICPQRFDCALFSRALEVNSGKEKVFEEVICKEYDKYEKK